MNDYVRLAGTCWSRFGSSRRDFWSWCGLDGPRFESIDPVRALLLWHNRNKCRSPQLLPQWATQLIDTKRIYPFLNAPADNECHLCTNHRRKIRLQDGPCVRPDLNLLPSILTLICCLFWPAAYLGPQFSNSFVGLGLNVKEREAWWVQRDRHSSSSRSSTFSRSMEWHGKHWTIKEPSKIEADRRFEFIE